MPAAKSDSLNFHVRISRGHRGLNINSGCLVFLAHDTYVQRPDNVTAKKISRNYEMLNVIMGRVVFLDHDTSTKSDYTSNIGQRTFRNERKRG